MKDSDFLKQWGSMLKYNEYMKSLPESVPLDVIENPNKYTHNRVVSFDDDKLLNKGERDG